MIIGFAAEMNGYWDPWGYGHTSPAVFVAAWRHLVTVFRRQGANNVIWLWTVDITEPGTGPVQDWWPGNSYVTWVGIDGYYYRRDYTFGDAFLPTIAEVRIFTQRPILLSETAIGQVAGQAAKIPDLFDGVRANHLLGFVWFDQNAVRRHLPPGLAARGQPGWPGRFPPGAEDVPRTRKEPESPRRLITG